MNREIDKYMTVSEAAHKWGIPQETIKNKLKPSLPSVWEQTKKMIDEGLLKFFKKEGAQRKEWIISTGAMEKWFGKK